VGEAVAVDLFDEVAQHALGDVEVGDHAVLQRPDRGDGSWCSTQHPLRLHADRMHVSVLRVHGHDRGLGEHDPATAHVHERVRGSQIDGHVPAAEAGQISDQTHR
jgi:hypothetical protein